jgi:hypothetical protein
MRNVFMPVGQHHGQIIQGARAYLRQGGLPGGFAIGNFYNVGAVGGHNFRLFVEPAPPPNPPPHFNAQAGEVAVVFLEVGGHGGWHRMGGVNCRVIQTPAEWAMLIALGNRNARDQFMRNMR